MMPHVQLLVAILASAAAEPNECQASGFDPEIRDSLLQASKRGGVHEDANDTQSTVPAPECIALAAAAASYRFDKPIPGYEMGGNSSAQMLIAQGYTFVKAHSITSDSGDHDYVGLWTKDGACFLNFKGSEHGDDGVNNGNSIPMTKWGLSGVHSGLVAELEPLVNMMDFEAIRKRCTGPLTVTGHSLGGGLAQLFALAINNPADPLGAQLTVDFLYTFGPMAVSVNELPNPAADDGCFAGGIYVDSLKLEDGTVQVDVVKAPSLGGKKPMQPVRTTKTLLFGPGAAPMVYDCAVTLPETVGSIPTSDPNNPYGVNMQWAYMHHPSTYSSFMGCSA